MKESEQSSRRNIEILDQNFLGHVAFTTNASFPWILGSHLAPTFWPTYDTSKP